ncbi:MAG TPA: asparagine synthase (glutamine-hydrolyzing) [bacterium]|jgi:asparagine synthase (glutamine-hydrolysing)
MCGFAGEFLLDEQDQVNPRTLERRACYLHHRGPDAQGTWHDELVGLSHVRLKLLDLDNGRQPMRSPQGTVLSYNGEIYNSTELRAELTVRGHEFRTVSDTEIVLAAYETWGAAAWNRLNGMFAFALYDPHKARLYLVRDRQGIKPAYYRFTPRAVEFGSEPSAWDHLHVGQTPLNPPGVLHYLRFAQPTSGAHSLFHDLKVLEPGTQLVVDQHGAVVERWFAPSQNSHVGTQDSLPVIRAKVRHLLHLAVGRQMVADAPVGVFLSGGVDSAILAGLLAQMRPERPRTYTIALEGDEAEFAPAQAVADRWKCRHTQVAVSPARFFEAMRDIVRLRHVPTVYPNEILICLLAQEAAADVKAVLTGEGADELFGGYTGVLTVFDLYTRALASPEPLKVLLQNVLKTENPNLDLRDDSRFFASVFSWFHPQELEPLLSRRWREHLHRFEAEDPFAGILRTFGGTSPENRFHWLLQYAHLPNLLGRLDGATMAASLEGRVPYTDTDLVEYVSALPHALKFEAGQPDKPLLRSIFFDLLPPEVAQRPKRAFDASLDRLFASPEGRRELEQINHSGPMSEIFNPSALAMWLNSNRSLGHWQKCWLLVCLNMWLNRNIL